MSSSAVRPLAGLGMVIAIAAIVVFSIGMFRGGFGTTVPVTVVSERAGLVMNPEAKVKLEETLKRRQELAERRIAQAEVQASAEVKAAAADLAARAAEQILTARLAGQKSDPLLDAAIAQIGSRLN